MPQSATKMPSSVSSPSTRGHQLDGLTVNQWRDQSADHQGDADGYSNAERHAKVTHGETVTHVADSPHGAKEKCLEDD